MMVGEAWLELDVTQTIWTSRFTLDLPAADPLHHEEAAACGGESDGSGRGG